MPLGNISLSPCYQSLSTLLLFHFTLLPKTSPHLAAIVNSHFSLCVRNWVCLCLCLYLLSSLVYSVSILMNYRLTLMNVAQNSTRPSTCASSSAFPVLSILSAVHIPPELMALQILWELMNMTSQVPSFRSSCMQSDQFFGSLRRMVRNILPCFRR